MPRHSRPTNDSFAAPTIPRIARRVSPPDLKTPFVGSHEGSTRSMIPPPPPFQAHVAQHQYSIGRRIRATIKQMVLAGIGLGVFPRSVAASCAAASSRASTAPPRHARRDPAHTKEAHAIALREEFVQFRTIISSEEAWPRSAATRAVREPTPVREEAITSELRSLLRASNSGPASTRKRAYESRASMAGADARSASSPVSQAASMPAN